MYRKANGVQTERQTELQTETQTDRQTDSVKCRGASLFKKSSVAFLIIINSNYMSSS